MYKREIVKNIINIIPFQQYLYTYTNIYYNILIIPRFSNVW